MPRIRKRKPANKQVGQTEMTKKMPPCHEELQALQNSSLAMQCRCL